VDAHRDCPDCCGKVTLWQRGDEVLRVTARKDEWGEVQSYDGKPGWICNTCRFEKKAASDWVIEGPTSINRHSVISQGHYLGLQKSKETIQDVMGGLNPRLLMDIHDVSEVNKLELSQLPGAATSANFKNESTKSE
jgi:NADH-quinone oxidoreductase subunit G